MFQHRRLDAAPVPLRFDPSTAPLLPQRQVDSRRPRAPAVIAGPHAALPPEGVATAEEHALEMRVFWGEALLDIHHFIEPKRITIGETKRATVFISSEGLPVDEFPLIRWVDERCVLTATAAMEGEVEIDGVLTSLAETRAARGASVDRDLEGARSIPLTLGDRAIVHWGGATFAFRFVTPPRRVPDPLLNRLEPHYLNTLLLSLFFHLTLIVTLVVHPGDVQATAPHRFFDAVVDLYPDVETVDTQLPQVPTRKEPPEKPGRQELARSPAERGNGTRRRPGTGHADKESVQRSFGRMLGSDAGLLGPGAGTLFGHIARVIGTHGRDGIRVGLRGFNTRGGPALGRHGDSRDAGPIKTRVEGLGRDPGLGDRRERGVPTFESPDVRDPLARDMIHKVVQQNRRQIRFCYERVLQGEHDLEGKVAVTWVIGGKGEVVEAHILESTLDNRDVERCMIEKIGRWRFPAPVGGGTVRVNYPFVFHAT